MLSPIVLLCSLYILLFKGTYPIVDFSCRSCTVAARWPRVARVEVLQLHSDCDTDHPRELSLFASSFLLLTRPAMWWIFFIIFHPLNVINAWLEDDPDGSTTDVAALLSIFLGFGSWLVYDRYQKAINKAIRFRFPTPEVSWRITTRLFTFINVLYSQQTRTGNHSVSPTLI